MRAAPNKRPKANGPNSPNGPWPCLHMRCRNMPFTQFLVPWHASLRIDFLTLTPLLTNAACGLLSDSSLRIGQTTPGACSGCEPGIWGVCRARFGLPIPNGSVLRGGIEDGQGVRYAHQANISPAWISAVCLSGFLNVGARMSTTSNLPATGTVTWGGPTHKFY